MNKKYRAEGFVETIVTVLIIGGLALAVWYLLNPLELVRKFMDTARLNNAREVATSIQHYYINYGFYPWTRANDNYLVPVRDQDRYYFYDPESVESDFGWIWNLVTAGQIKETKATSLTKKNEFYIFKPVSNGAEEVYVCFSPKSLEQREKAATACKETEEDKKTAPENYKEFVPCQSEDGTILIPEETGERNLLCVVE